jgi:hypothetical protein
MKRALSYIGFWLISLTWGGIMTWIGAIVALVLLITGHKPHRCGPNIYFVVGRSWGGVELGAFFLVCENSSKHTALHECGHGIQNCIWGPLMPFVVCIPSATRYWYREYLTRVKGVKPWMLPEYDSIWFEGQATRWGEKVYDKVYVKRQ